MAKARLAEIDSLNLQDRGPQLASWRYRGYAQNHCLHQRPQMDLHDDQAGLLWELA